MGLASAATSNSTDPQQSIIDKLATKFNLNKADVQKVFDEDRSAHEAARSAEVKTKLDQLVKDGKITQAQEDKLIAKAKELQSTHEANREKFKSMTEDERKSAMKSERDSLKQWLSDNGLTEEYGRYLMGRGGGPKGMGMGDEHHHMGPGGPNSTSESSIN